jgi:hypothetical protein
MTMSTRPVIIGTPRARRSAFRYPVAAMGIVWIFLATWCVAGESASGQTWMFRRSYYSHYPVQRVDVGAPTNTRLRYTEPTGAYVRWGWRNSNMSGNIRSSYDNFRVYESWIQSGAQY